jgi:LysM repeat protein
VIRKTNAAPTPVPAAAAATRKNGIDWLFWITWLLALLMVFWLTTVILAKAGLELFPRAAANDSPQPMSLPAEEGGSVAMPDYQPGMGVEAVARSASLHTIIPDESFTIPKKYMVESGDSVFGIAQYYKLEPETVLWANYNLLNDNPNMLSIGQELTIPAVDGVLYTVKAGDTVEGVAKKFLADPEQIIAWPGNDIDIVEPSLVAGQSIMIPGGQREMQSWVVPTIWRANSGANKSISAGCDTSTSGAYGTGVFMWPADNHTISGNTYWSGHLGIDIAAATGAPVYASDSGVVVYSAWIGGGYGNMVMIDHGNGFHTLYAHNSSLVARCGQGVAKGQVIAYAGSTGNSTGAHLHFEIRYGGMFVNPLDYVR